jgi:hypothetical protein
MKGHAAPILVAPMAHVAFGSSEGEARLEAGRASLHPRPATAGRSFAEVLAKGGLPEDGARQPINEGPGDPSHLHGQPEQEPESELDGNLRSPGDAGAAVGSVSGLFAGHPAVGGGAPPDLEPRVGAPGGREAEAAAVAGGPSRLGPRHEATIEWTGPVTEPVWGPGPAALPQAELPPATEGAGTPSVRASGRRSPASASVARRRTGGPGSGRAWRRPVLAGRIRTDQLPSAPPAPGAAPPDVGAENHPRTDVRALALLRLFPGSAPKPTGVPTSAVGVARPVAVPRRSGDGVNVGAKAADPVAPRQGPGPAPRPMDAGATRSSRSAGPASAGRAPAPAIAMPTEPPTMVSTPAAAAAPLMARNPAATGPRDSARAIDLVQVPAHLAVPLPMHLDVPPSAQPAAQSTASPAWSRAWSAARPDSPRRPSAPVAPGPPAADRADPRVAPRWASAERARRALDGATPGGDAVHAALPGAVGARGPGGERRATPIVVPASVRSMSAPASAVEISVAAPTSAVPAHPPASMAAPVAPIGPDVRPFEASLSLPPGLRAEVATPTAPVAKPTKPAPLPVDAPPVLVGPRRAGPMVNEPPSPGTPGRVGRAGEPGRVEEPPTRGTPRPTTERAAAQSRVAPPPPAMQEPTSATAPVRAPAKATTPPAATATVKAPATATATATAPVTPTAMAAVAAPLTAARARVSATATVPVAVPAVAQEAVVAHTNRSGALDTRPVGAPPAPGPGPVPSSIEPRTGTRDVASGRVPGVPGTPPVPSNPGQPHPPAGPLQRAPQAGADIDIDIDSGRPDDARSLGAERAAPRPPRPVGLSPRATAESPTPPGPSAPGPVRAPSVNRAARPPSSLEAPGLQTRPSSAAGPKRRQGDRPVPGAGIPPRSEAGAVGPSGPPSATVAARPGPSPARGPAVAVPAAPADGPASGPRGDVRPAQPPADAHGTAVRATPLGRGPHAVETGTARPASAGSPVQIPGSIAPPEGLRAGPPARVRAAILEVQQQIPVGSPVRPALAGQPPRAAGSRSTTTTAATATATSATTTAAAKATTTAVGLRSASRRVFDAPVTLPKSILFQNRSAHPDATASEPAPSQPRRASSIRSLTPQSPASVRAVPSFPSAPPAASSQPAIEEAPGTSWSRRARRMNRPRRLPAAPVAREGRLAPLAALALPWGAVARPLPAVSAPLAPIAADPPVAMQTAVAPAARVADQLAPRSAAAPWSRPTSGARSAAPALLIAGPISTVAPVVPSAPPVRPRETAPPSRTRVLPSQAAIADAASGLEAPLALEPAARARRMDVAPPSMIAPARPVPVPVAVGAGVGGAVPGQTGAAGPSPLVASAVAPSSLAAATSPSSRGRAAAAPATFSRARPEASVGTGAMPVPASADRSSGARADQEPASSPFATVRSHGARAASSDSPSPSRAADAEGAVAAPGSSRASLPAPVPSPTLAPTLAPVPTPPWSGVPSPELGQSSPGQTAHPAGRVLQAAAEDESLHASALGHTAHVRLRTASGEDLSLHLRVRDGVADVRVETAIEQRADGGEIPRAPRSDLRASEVRTALAGEGLALGRFESSTTVHLAEDPSVFAPLAGDGGTSPSRPDARSSSVAALDPGAVGLGTGSGASSWAGPAAPAPGAPDPSTYASGARRSVDQPSRALAAENGPPSFAGSNLPSGGTYSSPHQHQQRHPHREGAADRDVPRVPRAAARAIPGAPSGPTALSTSRSTASHADPPPGVHVTA